jgi:hypothetical protein
MTGKLAKISAVIISFAKSYPQANRQLTSGSPLGSKLYKKYLQVFLLVCLNEIFYKQYKWEIFLHYSFKL